MTTEPANKGDNDRVNFFLPQAGFMRHEVRLIKIMLAAWLLGSFGFPLLLADAQHNLLGESFLTEGQVWGFPLHFLVSGQGVILFFILICFLFNALMDRLTARRRGRRR